MSETTPPQLSPQERLARLAARRDLSAAHASELAKGIAQPQAIRFQTIVLELMQRSDDQPAIVEALVELLRSLEHCAAFGASEKPLTKGRVEMIANAIYKAAEDLSPRNH